MKVDADAFKQEVYAVVASIPYGKVLTYGQVAWLVGRPKHSRMVGHVLCLIRPAFALSSCGEQSGKDCSALD